MDVPRQFVFSKGYKPIDLVDRDRIGLLQSLLVKNGNFIPGIAVAVEDNLADSAEISVSSVLELDDLPADGTWFGLDYPIAQLIPVNGKVPVVRMNVKADNATKPNIPVTSLAVYKYSANL